MFERLALGTVQFGLPYGISNAGGQIDQQTGAAILKRCRTLGIGMLDTAEAYGTAEAVLGQHGVSDFDIVSKLGRFECAPAEIATQMRARVQAIMERLGTQRLYGLMLHAPDQLFEERDRAEAILNALDALCAEGLVGRFGVSTYDPDMTRRLFDLHDFSIVQLPICPIDGRWDDSGILDQLNAAGVEIHVRSVYLQGLLLMPPEALPSWSTPWQGVLRDWQDWCRQEAGDPVSGCIALTLARPQVDRVVIGVQDAAQIDAAVAALEFGLPPLPARFKTTDRALLEPFRWPKD